MNRFALPAMVALLVVVRPVFADTDAGAAARGKALYEQRCAACHTIGEGNRVGPDLQGVTERRDEDWLRRFIADPNALISAGDPVAVALYEQFNRIVMPNLGLDAADTAALLGHLRVATAVPAAVPQRAAEAQPLPPLIAPQRQILGLFVGVAAIVVVVFAWVGWSTRSPADVDVKRAYGLRRVLLVCAVATFGGLLLATIGRTPYALADVEVDEVVYVAARQFDFVFSMEPITSVDELPEVQHSSQLSVPAGALVEFRVTSLDVNHGFGLYGPERQLIAQTQAMPGYFNRLRVRLGAPADYRVLCLEYCAAGHHLMQTRIVVE